MFYLSWIFWSVSPLQTVADFVTFLFQSVGKAGVKRLHFDYKAQHTTIKA